VWLLVNELISILENIGRIAHIIRLVLTLLKRLKQTAEDQGKEVLPK
jgi:phage-related holin